jgi:hypothetical protein
MSITMMRDPVSRAISSFKYGGIHSNLKNCKKDQDKCFETYTETAAWQNVAVKMLTGLYAYDGTKKVGAYAYIVI